MTIERGAEWGQAGPLGPDGVTVSTDAEAREVVTAARRSNSPLPELGLLGGDLARTCGVATDRPTASVIDRLRSTEARRLPVDVGAVLVDGVLHWFTAHLVARRSWWKGPILVVMNAQFIGEWDVAPRSHPNDGRVDVLEVEMSIADRVKARRRLRTGDHVPHPGIAERRVSAAQFDLAPRMSLWLDGALVASEARSLSLRVEPDALTVVV